MIGVRTRPCTRGQRSCAQAGHQRPRAAVRSAAGRAPSAPHCAEQDQKLQDQQAWSPSRREWLGCALVLLGARAPAVQAAEEPSSSAPAVEYVNPQRGYRMRVPSAWAQVDKAGADVLFEDPDRRSTSVGVVVNPVKVKTIREFGPMEVVGEKLLAAEKAKDGTLSVAMLSQGQRERPSGALLYDFEYDLNSTRGRKRILNTVTIFDGQLYILNAAYKCDKGEGGCSKGEPVVQALRDVAASFDVAAK